LTKEQFSTPMSVWRYRLGLSREQITAIEFIDRYNHWLQVVPPNSRTIIGQRQPHNPGYHCCPRAGSPLTDSPVGRRKRWVTPDS
jgi:hypothetical protein